MNIIMTTVAEQGLDPEFYRRELERGRFGELANSTWARNGEEPTLMDLCVLTVIDPESITVRAARLRAARHRGEHRLTVDDPWGAP